MGGQIPELDSLTAAGEVVLDGEVMVVTPDGWADFDLLAARLHVRHDPDTHPVIHVGCRRGRLRWRALNMPLKQASTAATRGHPLVLPGRED
jgi:hypothetical protein